jgi:hypothetical protein
MTKTKIALAAALFAASSSAAFAQFDPNLANRYPGYAAPGAYGYVAGANNPSRIQSAPGVTLQSASVSLQKHGKASLQSAPVRLQQRDDALPGTGEGYYDGDREFNADRFDRASSPYAGGN